MKISEALAAMEQAHVGGVMQAFALVLIDRGHPIEIVTQRMCMSGDTIEQAMWDATLGPAVDSVADYLGLGAYPDDFDAITDTRQPEDGPAPGRLPT